MKVLYTYTFLVDYKNSLTDSSPEISIEDEIYHNNRIDRIISSALASNTTRPRGRRSNTKVQCRVNRVNLGDPAAIF